MTTSTSNWTMNVILAQSTPEVSAVPAQPRPVGMPGTTSQPATAPGGAAPAGTQQAAPSSMMLWLILLMFGVMIIPAMLSGRREKKRRAELMASLKKNDKVQTLGGIIGTISELTEQEVVLKVEDGRIRFARSAIQGVIQSTNSPVNSFAEPKDAKAVSV
ncbi:MAG: preprotein translocase subunit YajC [Phycisphaerae bacterium]|nr:preprotein translocase subunit YajC [Phycisphaerae bacterium]